MRVLVTGASGVFGRGVCAGLHRAGADVVGFARRGVAVPGVESVPGDIRDADALIRAAKGCDRVVHLAWAVTPLHSAAETAAVNLGGTANVLRAAEQAGCDRIVFASSVTAYGAWPDNPERFTEDAPLRPDPRVLYAYHKAEAEKLVAASGIPAVVTRSAVTVGRTLDNYEFRFLTVPLLVTPKGPARPWQLAHESDIARYHVQLALGDRLGTVNLGPDDIGLSVAEIAEVLGKPLIRMPGSWLAKVAEVGWERNLVELDPATIDAFAYMPAIDNSRAREWGLRPTFTSREALEDTAVLVTRTWYIGPRRVDLPWRLASPPYRYSRGRRTPADDPALIDPAPPGLRGEFDGYSPPRWDTWSSANVSEAFPGPMTPLSLELALDALGGAGATFVPFLRLTGDVAEGQRAHVVNSFGHRVYANLSLLHAMAEAMPGTDAAEFDEQFMGSGRSARSGPPIETTRREKASSLRAVAAHTAGLRRELRRLEARAARCRYPDDHLRRLDDGQLLTLVERLHHDVVDAWTVSTPINMVGAGIEGILRKLTGRGGEARRGGLAELVSGKVAQGVTDLAAEARRHPAVADALRTRSGPDVLAALDSLDAAFARRFAALVAEVGHRGPGETELSNEMYGDRPELLLAMVAKALDVDPPTAHLTGAPPGGGVVARRLEAAMHGWLRRRERARDAVVLITHAFRRAVREHGRRLVAARVLQSVDDVFYLAYDELWDARRHAGRIPARRAERERLARLRIPTTFTGRWEPESDTHDGSTLSGLGVSPGTAEGRARVLDSTTITDLEPGEVLVAHVTDTGWTSVFPAAAAVVTDLGGVLGHAAIVARELGIPCVVATGSATTALRHGPRVRVDGSAGTVEILPD